MPASEVTRVRIAVLREPGPETRTSATGESVRKLVGLGAEVVVQSGAGEASWIGDDAYASAGARVVATAEEALDGAGVVLRVGRPALEDVPRLPAGCVLVGFLDPLNDAGLVRSLAEHGVTAVSMELMPRTTLAQKMDALSSQHSLAGYFMVVLAAERLGKAFPMMVTPSGTIQPARVFVIGAGVAGLQAIATARRLGARVEAFDTRPAVKEQVASLGAKFVEIDLGQTGEAAGGYAKELTEAQRAMQRDGMAKRLVQCDVVISTAQVFGRRAPRLVDRAMLEQMRPGSFVVDYAVMSGGNVEGSEPDREVTVGPARVLGLANFPGRVAADASRMYANNLSAFVEHFWDKDSKSLVLREGDEIASGSTVTRGGEVVHPMVRERMGLPALGVPRAAGGGA